jgi:hypothetical protein
LIQINFSRVFGSGPVAVEPSSSRMACHAAPADPYRMRYSRFFTATNVSPTLSVLEGRRSWHLSRLFSIVWPESRSRCPARPRRPFLEHFVSLRRKDCSAAYSSQAPAEQQLAFESIVNIMCRGAVGFINPHHHIYGGRLHGGEGGAGGRRKACAADAFRPRLTRGRSASTIYWATSPPVRNTEHNAGLRPASRAPLPVVIKICLGTTLHNYGASFLKNFRCCRLQSFLAPGPAFPDPVPLFGNPKGNAFPVMSLPDDEPQARPGPGSGRRSWHLRTAG